LGFIAKKKSKLPGRGRKYVYVWISAWNGRVFFLYYKKGENCIVIQARTLKIN